MELDIYKTDGTPSGEKITLPPEIFDIKPNDHAIYQAVRVYLSNQRQGTSKTKTKGEVSGSGKKPWRQKKTGRARIGTHRSPLWKGGGTIFGPLPRDYSMQLPNKIKKLAKKSALTYRAREDAIKVVQDFILDKPKTKDIVSILKALKLDNQKTVLLVPQKNEEIFKSARNIPNLQVIEAAKISTYDVMNNHILLFQKSSLQILEKTFKYGLN